jgi:hypothetical protein
MIDKTYQKLQELIGEEKIFRLSFAIGFFFFLLSTLLLFLKFKSLPPQVPLFYSKPWGEERIPAKIWLWLIPSLSMLILLFNFLILPPFLKKERFLVIVLSLVSVASLFLLFWTLFRIIFLVS